MGMITGVNDHKPYAWAKYLVMRLDAFFITVMKGQVHIHENGFHSV